MLDTLPPATPSAGQAEPAEADPVNTLIGSRLQPDPWQADLMRSEALRTLVLCSRQAGKSTTAAALAVHTAVNVPSSLVLLLSPTLRQSGELFRAKVLRQWRALGCPGWLRKPTQLELELSNGSRIVSLPENEEGIRGFSSVTLLVIDEASRVNDSLYRAVRPMLAVSNGRLVALSTPFGKRGWFYEAWNGDGGGWERVSVTADKCPRITAEFLADEEKELGPRWYRQEYFNSFEDTVDAVFSYDAIMRTLTPGIKALEFPS